MLNADVDHPMRRFTRQDKAELLRRAGADVADATGEPCARLREVSDQTKDARGRELKRQPFLKSADEKIANVDGEGGIWPVSKGETTVTVKVDDLEKRVRVRVEKVKR